MRWFAGAVLALIATAALASAVATSPGTEKAEFVNAAKAFKASLAVSEVPSRAEWLLDELIDELVDH